MLIIGFVCLRDDIVPAEAKGVLKIIPETDEAGPPLGSGSF